MKLCNIETEHPGYLGAQDTYYVGTIQKRRLGTRSAMVYVNGFIEQFSTNFSMWLSVERYNSINDSQQHLDGDSGKKKVPFTLIRRARFNLAFDAG